MALDSVYLDIKDLDGLRAEADDAVAVGFDAKVAIHPTQVAVIRAGLRTDRRPGASGRDDVLDTAARGTRRLPIRGHNGGCPSAAASRAHRPASATPWQLAGRPLTRGFALTASVLSTSVA